MAGTRGERAGTTTNVTFFAPDQQEQGREPETGSARPSFLRSARAEAASSVPLMAAVYVASGSVVAGLAAAVAVVALRPVIRACASRVWRSPPDRG